MGIITASLIAIPVAGTKSEVLRDVDDVGASDERTCFAARARVDTVHGRGCCYCFGPAAALGQYLFHEWFLGLLDTALGTWDRLNEGLMAGYEGVGGVE